MNKGNRKEKEKILEMLPGILATTAINPDDQGFLIDIRKITNKLNISYQTLMRYLWELQKQKRIRLIHRGYETGSHTMRWAFPYQKNPTVQEIIQATDFLNSNKPVKEFEIDLTNPLLAEIDKMTNLVNEWSPIKLTNSCRWSEWKTGKIKIRDHKGS